VIVRRPLADGIAPFYFCSHAWDFGTTEQTTSAQPANRSNLPVKSVACCIRAEADIMPLEKTMPFTEEDKQYMELAINESEHDPREFKVGALIVREGHVLARAHGGEPDAPRQHAELTAIKKCSGIDLTGATIYATLEPCVPDARKPNKQPCAVEILSHPFRRVVIGVLDPNKQVRGKGREMLQTDTLDVVVCTDHRIMNRIQTLNREFFQQSWSRFAEYPVFSLGRHFQGRVSERAMLTDWVSRRGEHANAAVLVLSGIGGVGKTNLTGFWAKHDVADMELPGYSEEANTSGVCVTVANWHVLLLQGADRFKFAVGSL